MILRKHQMFGPPRFSLCAAAAMLTTSVLIAAPVAAQMAQQPPAAAAGSQAAPMTPGTTTSPTGMSGQASSSQQAGAQSGQSITDRLPDRYQLSNWMGKAVKNNAGEQLGTVEELVMDDVGLLRYVILKSDLLTENKEGNLVAVPVGHFEFPLARQDHLVLDVPAGRMQGAPAFSERRDMPNMGRPEISSVIIAYWVPEAAAQEGQGQAAQTGTGGQQQQQQQQQQSAMGGYHGNRDMIKLSQRKSELFEQLDKNDSGAIERSEAQAHKELSERFSEADTYGNEAITRSEFAAFELGDDPGAGTQRDATRPLNPQPGGALR